MRITSEDLRQYGFEDEVKPGRILFEIGGIDETIAREALRLAAGKLPLKTKIVKRQDAPNPKDIEAGGESK